MQRKSIYTAGLVTFFLLGTISLAMGETSDQSDNTSMPIINNTGNITIPTANITEPVLYEATVNNVNSTNDYFLGRFWSMANLTLIYNNGSIENIGYAQVQPGTQEINMYNTLNSAYLKQKNVIVSYDRTSDKIGSVYYKIPMVNDIGNISLSSNITVPNGLYEATVDNVASVSISNRSMAYLTLIYDNGSTENIGYVLITTGHQEVNMYNTFNSAYLEQEHVKVSIKKNSAGQAMITDVWYMPTTKDFKL